MKKEDVPPRGTKVKLYPKGNDHQLVGTIFTTPYKFNNRWCFGFVFDGDPDSKAISIRVSDIGKIDELLSRLKVAYIAGPYRAKTRELRQQNIDAAAEVAKKYWQLGYAVICPHMNSAHFDGNQPDEFFLEGYLEILRRCDVIVMISGWSESDGAKAEYNLARKLGMEIKFE